MPSEAQGMDMKHDEEKKIPHRVFNATNCVPTTEPNGMDRERDSVPA